jgi:hypothetical protein
MSETSPLRRLRWPRRPLPYYFAALLLGVAVGAVGDLVGSRLLETLGAALASAFCLLVVGTLAARALRRLLWRVGRRLAFSYFLIGVLPIPLVALLALLVTGMMAGFFVGHLYRDAVDERHLQLADLATRRLDSPARAGPAAQGDIAFADYRNGRRVGGDERFPAEWPGWIPVGGIPPHDPRESKEAVPPFVALADGRPGLAAAAGD